MINQKNINNVLESWGNSKRELPPNNEVLKKQVMSSIPVEINKTAPHGRAPSLWFSYAFTAMAAVTLVVSYGNGEVSRNFAVSAGSSVSLPTEVALEESYDVDNQNQNEEYYSAKTVRQDSAGETVASGFGMTSTPAPAPDMYIYESMRQTPPVSDLREFIKINYNATLRTRHVADLIGRTEVVVRGFGGRVDSLNSSDKWGHVSFVVPKSKFDAFREEITSMVGSRFVVEQTNSQNLLGTKQSIEANQKQIDTTLVQLKSDRAQVVKNHNQNISLYQTRISSINLEITTLQIEYKQATPTRQAEIIRRINEMQVEIGNIENEIIRDWVIYSRTAHAGTSTSIFCISLSIEGISSLTNKISIPRMLPFES